MGPCLALGMDMNLHEGQCHSLSIVYMAARGNLSILTLAPCPSSVPQMVSSEILTKSENRYLVLGGHTSIRRY